MNKLKKNNSGFTLLEIIIVVIIVGVLASLALPRLFSNVEFSRSTEAMAAVGTIRSSIERCFLRQGTYDNCENFSDEGTPQLDINNPENTAGSLFDYAIAGNGTAGYSITATRNTSQGGDNTHTITATADSTGVNIVGTGAFVSL